MLVTDNDEYAARARALRSHGITRDPAEFSNPDENATILNERGSWYYEMQALGYNYRITDIQCALGRSQLRKLPDFISRRLQIVARYNEAFAELTWLSRPAVHLENSRALISWHLYTVQIDFKALGKHRTDVMKELRHQGVGTQVLYIPVYLQPWYRKTYGYSVGKCPNAEAYYEKALSLPLYPEMTDSDVDSVIRRVKELAK